MTLFNQGYMNFLRNYKLALHKQCMNYHVSDTGSSEPLVYDIRKKVRICSST